MAFIGVKIPASAAATLAGVKVPGEHISPEDMHVTLLYLGKNVPIPEVLQATLACYLMTKRWAPFKATTKQVTTFPKNIDGIPVIAKVLCPELHKLHEAIKKSLDFMEIEYSKKFPDFKPHITLAYSDSKIGASVKMTPITWTVEEIVVWGGDDGDERIAITLPLEGGPGILNPMKKETTFPMNIRTLSK